MGSEDQWADELVRRVALVAKNEATLVVIRALDGLAIAARANGGVMLTEAGIVAVKQMIARGLIEATESELTRKP